MNFVVFAKTSLVFFANSLIINDLNFRTPHLRPPVLMLNFRLLLLILVHFMCFR